jgi:glucose/arabinose dehydrogenase
MRTSIIIIALLIGISCNQENNTNEFLTLTKQTLGYLEVPAGFSVDVFAEGVEGARQMALGDDGIIYIGTRRTGENGKLYAVIDSDNDFKADEVTVVASGLRMPNGVAYRDGDLYVAEVSNIWRYDDIDETYNQAPEPELIRDDYPTESSHGWKYIAFGPDDKLYVPVGAPCNVCNHEDENPIYASLTRINADGSDREIIAHGIRNTVGFTWHPETQNLWFTDNGRDWMGDDIPACELNEITEEGAHFGFPYLHGNDIWDPEFGTTDEIKSRDFTKPVQELGPHVAPLGLLFYTGDMFPDFYKNQALIAEHGSWNRTEKIGYRITLVTFDENGAATSYQPFIKGWLQGEEEIKGRPVAFLQLPDGSVLISDDHTGTIYRVSYTG